MPLTRYESALHRLSSLLETLSAQAIEVDKINSKNKSHWLIENDNLFSQHLFTTESDLFLPYVNEVKKRLGEFSRLYAASSQSDTKAEFAMSSLLQVEQQISALMNAMQSSQTMHQAAQLSFDARKKVKIHKHKAEKIKQQNQHHTMAKSVLLSSHELYQKLSEHHEFERRLMDMVTEREQQLQRSTSSNADKLSQEVLALHQRLGRCRKAITAIEQNIEISEKGSFRKG